MNLNMYSMVPVHETCDNFFLKDCYYSTTDESADDLSVKACVMKDQHISWRFILCYKPGNQTHNCGFPF